MRFKRFARLIAPVALGGAIVTALSLAAPAEAQVATIATPTAVAAPAVAPVTTITVAPAAATTASVSAVTTVTKLAWHWSHSQSHSGGTGFSVRADVPKALAGGNVYEIINGRLNTSAVATNVPAGAGHLIASKPVAAGAYVDVQFALEKYDVQHKSRHFHVTRAVITNCRAGVNQPAPAGTDKTIYLETDPDLVAVLDTSNANLLLQNGRQLGGVYPQQFGNGAHADFSVAYNAKVVCSGAGSDIFVLTDVKPMRGVPMDAGATFDPSL
jgi:hypothetical protein